MKTGLAIVMIVLLGEFLNAESLLLKLDDFKWTQGTHSSVAKKEINGTVTPPQYEENEKGGYFSSKATSTEKPNFFFHYGSDFSDFKLPESFKVTFRIRFTCASAFPTKVKKLTIGLTCHDDNGNVFQLISRNIAVENGEWNNIEVLSETLNKRFLSKSESKEIIPPIHLTGAAIAIYTNSFEEPMDLTVNFSDVEIHRSEEAKIENKP